MFSGSITRRFAFWFVVLAFLPIVLVSYGLLHVFAKELKQAGLRHVEDIADKKTVQIEHYLSDLRQGVLLKAQDAELAAIIARATGEFAQGGTGSAALRKLDAQYRAYFQRYIQAAGYDDLYLVTRQGAVVYSYRHAADSSGNLLQGPYRNGALAATVRKALQDQAAAISSFDKYAPAQDAVAQFVAAPVINRGHIEGVFAVRLGYAHFLELILDRRGLGESGESAVARKLDSDTALMLAPLRADPDAAFRQRFRLHDAQYGMPLTFALERQSGGGYWPDYAGTAVAAAWRFLPELDIGMVTQTDEAEVLAPYYRVRNFTLLVLGVTTPLLLLAAVMLGRRVVLPLRQVNRSAQELAAGRFSTRLPEDRRDELGQLATAFNRMAGQLQASYAELESRIAQRTRELQQHVENLLVKDAAIASSLSAIAFAGMDGKINYVNKSFVELWRLPDATFVLGRSPLEFWEKPEEAQAVMDTLMSAGAWQGGMRAKLHDGELAEIELVANLVRDACGQPLCLMASFHDVTAQRRAEMEVQQARDQLAATIAAIPDLLFELDLHGVYHDIEAQDEALLTAPRAAMYGRTVREILPADAAAMVLAALREADVQGVSHGRQIHVPTPAGKLWFEISVARKKMREGQLPHFIVLSREITARKQLEEGLGRSLAGLKEAQRLAQMGNWELNLQSGVLAWSDEIFSLFEIDRQRFGATYEAFLNAIHPEDREMVNQAYTRSLEDRKPYVVVHRLLMADGRIKWVEERGETEFSGEGTPLLSRGTVQDITRQKLVEDKLVETESRYQGMVAALSEGVVLNAKDGAIIAANESARRILGLSLEQMYGTAPLDPLWRAVHEDGGPFHGDDHPGAVTLRTGQAQSNVIMGVHKPDGSLTWISVNSQPILQPGEALPSLAVVSFVDITERKNAETLLKKTNEELERRVELRTSLLRKAKEEAEQANHSKSLFLTSMSHELRTPLNAVLGYAQLMEMDSGLSQTMLENAKEIRRAGEYLLNLMNDILDLSRIEAGKLELRPENVALAGVVSECRAHNARAAETQNITLHVADSCAAFHVHADRRALLQVLDNLVSNAIKYNRAGGRINLSCSEEVHGKVKISVMDTGKGIAADRQQQLFQLFNRLGAEMGNIEGSGIGLVISKKLVEAMGGRIGMESVHGLGSTFWIELQLIGKLNLPAQAAGGPGQIRSASHKVPQLLVVEDYVPNQKVLLLQLQAMGCDVEVAPDGAAALQAWRSKPYDLVLTDIDMPVMNGVELAQAVREAERVKGGRVPLIAITATISDAESRRYRAAGIDEVLGKPLTMDALRMSLARWLGDFSSSPPAAWEVSPASRRREPAGVLDLNYLYRILGQVNIEHARMLLDTFLKASEEGLAALSAQSHNAVLVAKEMHKQKSSARTVGAMRYAEMAARLEQRTKDADFTGIGAALRELKTALGEVKNASANLLVAPEGQHRLEENPAAIYSSVTLRSVLVVDDDLVVLQQVKAMLEALGVGEVLTALNGLEAGRLLASRNNQIEVLVCDLSMPEMDGVELIRSFGKSGFRGGLILISGADEKLLSTVNKLAVLQGVRVLGQLQKPVNAAQLAVLLAHTTDTPVQQVSADGGPHVSKLAVNMAMERSEFTIWFQPKVDADTLRVTGMEALARWPQADGKYIPPDNFITVAEREGIIGELSQLLVSLALHEAAKIFAAGYPLKIAINLSGAWLNDLSLPDYVLSRTRLAGLRAEDVILEVTETGVMEDLTTALDVLTRLRLKGFGLSIDDFGIGYSSFEQLGRIPFTEMKLDRSFVSRGADDPAARAILESSMDMAHKLKLLTVAEGVETGRDLKLVRSLGCDLVQGYFIARPMPLQDMLAWLDKNKHGKQQGS